MAGDIPVEQCLRLFKYKDGKIYWIVNIGRKIRAGREAGCFNKSSERFVVRYNGLQYYRSRIVWTITNGDIPSGMLVDHINGNKIDDSIENLRIVTPMQNSWNVGFKNINKKMSKTMGMRYYPQVSRGGKSFSVGAFGSIEEATVARNKFAAQISGGFFNRGGNSHGTKS